MFIEVTEFGTDQKLSINIAHIISVKSRLTTRGPAAHILFAKANNEHTVNETYEEVMTKIQDAGGSLA